MRVVLTKHAFERLFERFEKKLDVRVVTNLIESVIRDGVILKGKRDLKIVTSNYTFCCAFDDGRLVIKTIMRTKEMGEKFRRALRFAKRGEWTNVYVENSRQIERWCKRAEQMKNVCKICGISRDQAKIERCRIYGFYVCGFCCEVIGYGSERCIGCAFYIPPRKFRGKVHYIA